MTLKKVEVASPRLFRRLVEIMRDVPGAGDNRQNDRDRNRDVDRNQERENPKECEEKEEENLVPLRSRRKLIDLKQTPERKKKYMKPMAVNVQRLSLDLEMTMTRRSGSWTNSLPPSLPALTRMLILQTLACPQMSWRT